MYIQYMYSIEVLSRGCELDTIAHVRAGKMSKAIVEAKLCKT